MIKIHDRLARRGVEDRTLCRNASSAIESWLSEHIKNTQYKNQSYQRAIHLGSRPFARSPRLSMPAEFARRAAVNGIPAQSTIFSSASLTANPECAVRPQFQSAVMITRFTCSFNVLARGAARQCR